MRENENLSDSWSKWVVVVLTGEGHLTIMEL